MKEEIGDVSTGHGAVHIVSTGGIASNDGYPVRPRGITQLLG